MELQNMIGAVHAIYITYLARWSGECDTADDASPADSFLFKIIDEVKKLLRKGSVWIGAETAKATARREMRY